MAGATDPDYASVHPVDADGTRLGQLFEEVAGVAAARWMARAQALVDVKQPAWWASLPGARAAQLVFSGLATTTLNPRIGLALGERRGQRALGIGDYLISAARDLRHVCELVERYQSSAQDFVTFAVTEAGALSTVTFTPQAGLELHPVAVDYRVARLIEGTRQFLADASYTPVEIGFAYPRPESTYAYRDRYGAEVRLRFDVDVAYVTFPTEVLDRPNPRRDDLLLGILLRQAQDVLDRASEAPAGTAQRLHGVISEQLQGGRPSAQKAARALGLSDRTLRRRLADEGHSFQSIVDRVRESMAQHYLDNPRVSDDDLAERLGFESLVAFRRAFRRWTGSSLREQRKIRLAEIQGGRVSRPG